MWWKVIGGLLALLAVVIVGGFVISIASLLIKAIFWLVVIGGLLALGTAAIGWVRKSTKQIR